jgi:hypothetical protein
MKQYSYIPPGETSFTFLHDHEQDKMGLINQGSIFGVVATLTATVLLGIVALNVPYFKSIYFLRADIVNPNGTPFTVDFGVLGYCGSLNGGPVSCTSPRVGYEIGSSLPSL